MQRIFSTRPVAAPRRGATAAGSLPVLVLLLLLRTIPPTTSAYADTPAAPETPPEIGWAEADSTGHADIPPLTSLDARLQIAAEYTRFTGDGMKDEYGGIPAVAAVLDFRVGRAAGGFLSLGYGQHRGNSLAGQPGFADRSDLRLRTVPIRVGVRVDGANSSRVRFWFGAALEVAWMQETIPYLDADGRIRELTSSVVGSGFAVMVGPEFALGGRGRTLGLELGWGGAKGDLSGDGQTHGVDTTGLRGRLYYALPL